MSKYESQRNYSISDADMIQEARIMHGLFTEDKPAFGDFDNLFADPFAENWLLVINNANDVIRDNFYEAGLTEKTKIVQDFLNAAKSHYQKVKYFVEKAFPDHREIWNQFGVSDYDEARKSEVKMILFLGFVYNAALQYKDHLLAAGLPEADIEKIKSLQTDLSKADLEQEKLKKKRPEFTQERIAILNQCYDSMQKVSKAGKIIFNDNYVKYNQYLLPNERSVKKEETVQPNNQPVE